MNLSLPPDLEEWIERMIQSDRYHSRTEAVHVALRLLKDHEQLRDIRLEELRRDIAIGIEQLERGEYTEYDKHSLKDLIEDIQARGRRRLAASNP